MSLVTIAIWYMHTHKPRKANAACQRLIGDVVTQAFRDYARGLASDFFDIEVEKGVRQQCQIRLHFSGLHIFTVFIHGEEGYAWMKRGQSNESIRYDLKQVDELIGQGKMLIDEAVQSFDWSVVPPTAMLRR